MDPKARVGWYILLATIPAGLIGLILKNVVEVAFASPLITASSLFVTAILLLVAERAGSGNRPFGTLTWRDTLWIGFFQALAIFPGISRSGATITGGMTRDLDRPAAARFSFLMSVPILILAGCSASLDLIKIPNLSSVMLTFIPGFLTAAIVGYLTIRWLLSFLSRHPLYIFSIYCILMGLVTLGGSILGR
jgi:undecaprenyl-diphosphatase